MNADTILEFLPREYRWASEIECELWSHETYFSLMVQIRRGSDTDTDLAIKMIDTLCNSVAREGLDYCICGCKYWEADFCIDCNAHISEVKED